MYIKIILLCILLICINIFIFSQNKKNIENFNNQNINEITIDTVHLRTEEEKRKGLMFIKKMDFNKGALFEYDQEGIHCVWMKNTYIPLDLIYLDSEFKIIEMIPNMKPHDLNSKCNVNNAKFFLEVNKGFINEKKLKIGDKINCNIIDNI